MFCNRILNWSIIPKLRHYTSSATKLINVMVDDSTGYTTVALNKPPVNTLDLELLNELSTVLTDLDFQNSRGMILTSSLERVFCAGLDIMEFYKPKPDKVRTFYSTLQDVWMKLYGSKYPVVAVINGHAPAGGCLLASSCEYRIMLQKFTIGFNATKLGILAPNWCIKTFENIVGRRKAEYAFTSGHMFTTDEALQIGLVDELGVNKADALNKAQRFLNKYDTISQLARSKSKTYFRNADIEELRNNRQQDMEPFLSEVMEPIVQKNIESYLANLKNKKI